MGVFEVQIGGKTYEVEAPDQGAALQAIRGMTGSGQRADGFSRDTAMGSDGVSGDMIRAGNAGDTRSQMRPQDIEAAYGVAQAAGNKPEQLAMARAFVDRERRDAPTSTGISDRLRTVARGVPFIGEYLDEANAAAAHPFDAKKREMRLDYERSRDATFDQNNPIQSLAGKATGGIAGTIAALPAAAATGTSVLLGAGAKSIPGAIARGATAGVAQGAASGYGREGTVEGATKDALVGGLFGAAIPAALSAGKAIFVRPPGDVLSSVPKRAQNFFMQQFGDPKSVAAMRTELDAMGPQAVLADVSPEMQMIARGAAARPGSRGPIVEALSARDAGKNARLQQGMNDALGPVVEPSVVKRSIKQAQRALGPSYDDILDNARAVDTKALASGIDAQIVNARGPIRAELEKARDLLNIYGTKELDPSPRALHAAREALDTTIEPLAREGKGKLVRVLSDVRSQLDDTLSAAAPGIKEVDAQYAELARQAQGLKEGGKIFRSGPDAIRPFDMAEQIAGKGVGPVGPSAVPLRMSQGARAELDRIVGSNANDVASLRNLLKGEGDWNRDKLRMLFGERKADQMLKVLDNESRMEGTFRSVVGGSQTAPTQGFREFIDEAGKGVTVPAEATAVGLGIRGAKSLLERLTGSNNEAKAARFADDLGRLSISGGDDARAIIEAIMKRQGRASSNAATTELFGRIGAGSARADDPAGIKAAMMAAIMARDHARAQDRSGSRR